MKLADLAWPRVAGIAAEMPIVFPIAAVEQHGHHLPLYTDSYLLGEVMRRVEEKMSTEIVVAPLQWLGNSDHHLDYGGTLTAAPRNYLDLLSGLMENALRHGFRKIVLVNGHGGNDIPGKQAIFEMRQRHRERGDLLLLMGTYWSLGEGVVPESAGLHQREMGHACEWETSMMLRLDQALVGDYRGSKPVDSGNAFKPGYRGWVTQDRSEPGHIGYPHLATAEKGEWLFSRFAGDVVNWLKRVVAWDGHSWDG